MNKSDANLSKSKSRDELNSQISLGEDNLLSIYRQMVLCRIFDQRVWLLNRQGKAAIVASAQGHEAGQMGSVWALRPGKDQFYIYYRDLAVMISLGMTPREIMSGFTAKAGEPLSESRQFPTHGAYRKLGIINLSNVVGTQIPQAVGSALASKLRNEDVVTIVYFGDGASSVGDCHEAMNFAGIHKLPVIFFCENNRYAISVPLHKQMAVDGIASRAEGYGMPGVAIDGSDVVSVHEATSQAAIRARKGHGPTLIEASVERYLPHTSDDDDSLYRNAEDIKKSRQRDPLNLLKIKLENIGLLPDKLEKEIRSDATNQVNDATKFVESTPYPDKSTFYDHVYAPSKSSSE